MSGQASPTPGITMAHAESVVLAVICLSLALWICYILARYSSVGLFNFQPVSSLRDC